jgi:uncharacterized protein YkwD
VRHLRFAAVLLLLAPLPCCSLQESVGSIGPAAVEARGPAAVEARTTDADAAAAIISRYRAAKGLGPVRTDARLTAAAAHQAHANAKAGEVFHGDFEDRMERFGIAGESVENLASGAVAVDEVIVDWQESPGHDANLLLRPATRIGLARVDTPNDRHGPYWALVLAE